MRLHQPLMVGLMALVCSTSLARAGFTENFDSPTGVNGQVLYKAAAIYLATGAVPSGGDANGNAAVNGFITKTTNNANIQGGAFGNSITNDQSGSGFFLFHGTGGSASMLGVAWESFNPAGVVPNTLYQFSFYLTNANATNVASLQPMINGTDIGSPISAAGFFTDGNAAHQWQKFSVTWFSGGATTADLALRNLQANTVGNDFGIDTISLDPVLPEPHSLALLAMGSLGLVSFARRRRLV
jgi:hypothetical protein